MRDVRLKEADLLDMAADEVVKRGLFRGALGETRREASICRVCAMGAINAASSGNPFRARSVCVVWAIRAVEIQLEKERKGKCLWIWNDTKARNADSVARLFRRTAKRLRREANGTLGA